MAEPNGLAPRRDVRQSSRVRKYGIRDRVFESRAETIGKLDRTQWQEPATGTEGFDA
jgi:hypothetical protein